MSVAPELRTLVRERAQFACEYCGVAEIDTGGELTIDHYQPPRRGGSFDDPENLLYIVVTDATSTNQITGRQRVPTSLYGILVENNVTSIWCSLLMERSIQQHRLAVSLYAVYA